VLTISWHGRPEFKIVFLVVGSTRVSVSFDGSVGGFGLGGLAGTKSLSKLQGWPNGFGAGAVGTGCAGACNE